MENESTTIFLNKRHRKIAENFADLRCKDSSLYEKRGGFKREDIVIGAMAELAVYDLLRKKGLSPTKPDFSIHTKKSYDADLTDYVHNFHVKGQSVSSRKKYGCSWLMQRTDPIINKVKKLHYLVPCNVDLETNHVEVHGILSIGQLIQKGCIEECKVPWFQKYKVALYMKTINKELTKYSRWGFFKKAKLRITASR
jgi:hypothetical protein